MNNHNSNNGNNSTNHQSDNPQAGQGRPMPKKEQDLFKSVVKHYESKQYKKGLKAAESILKKFPKHGETLCMKGLITSYTGSKEDAVNLVKMGLMNDMRSHVCWHVYGLLHRAERNYNEAIKAYKQALRIDSDNLQILRDLSLLQIQMRDLAGFALTRHTILTLKPNQKNNWLSFALAKQLIEDPLGAIQVIDAYIGTLDENSQELDKSYEASELTLYKNYLLSQIPNNLSQAYTHLQQCKENPEKDTIVDLSSYYQQKAYYELQLEKYDTAQQTYTLLFQRGETENHAIHSGYMAALLHIPTHNPMSHTLKGTQTLATTIILTPQQKDTLYQHYHTVLCPSFPRSNAIQRLLLTLLPQGSQELQNAMDTYCRRKIRKGVPSLASDLSALFVIQNTHTSSQNKPYQQHQQHDLIIATAPYSIKLHPTFQILHTLVQSYIHSLESTSTFPNCTKEEPPSTLLWTWFLYSSLLEITQDYKQALIYADKCLEHTPTLVEVYELKGRLLQSAGDISSAAKCLDHGRELDKQDRYINNLTTKCYLMLNQEDTALKRMSLFTRHESDPQQNIFDMQSIWYELDLADCYARKGLWGKSLQKYLAVEKHFEDFHEDQFDFHAYCIRKVTLRSYVQTLQWEDDLWGHDYYRRAAEGIIKIYIHLHEHPWKETQEMETPDYASMTPAERKKAKAMARKQKKKMAKEAEVKSNMNTNVNSNDKSNLNTNANAKKKLPLHHDDPDGIQLMKKDALTEAKKYSATLVKNAPHKYSTWICQYDIAIRRQKMTMALQALFNAKSLDPNGNGLLTRIVDFVGKLSSIMENSSSPEVVKQLWLDGRDALLSNQSLDQYVSHAAEAVLENPLTNLSIRLEVFQSYTSYSICSSYSKMQDPTPILTNGRLDGSGVTVELCKEAIQCLKSSKYSCNDANKTKMEKW
eukprot:CAMPEP_0184857420 /NCGR_PEP_ID=MMETSP0580-20130426/2572_1 /TAXON_ID=1118495 /ORGANISM="Dactyliosolen fragilissimus" /LENGTH=925 /DNA_ID=CAMNT_0027353003 /DNA_START=58 /DNA_END=2832 /DNA_ORIENTATION=+